MDAIDGMKLVTKCATEIKWKAGREMVEDGMVAPSKEQELFDLTSFTKSARGYNVAVPEAQFLQYEMRTGRSRKEVESEVQAIYSGAEIREVNALLAEAESLTRVTPALLEKAIRLF